MVLDWAAFPIVRVSQVIAKEANGKDPTRAAKNNVSVGDRMVMCGTLQDRVTLVPSWEGISPSDALIQKIQRKAQRKDNPVAGFAFLRKKHETKYLQLVMEDQSDWGWTVQNGKIVDVAAGGIASKKGLQKDDRIVIAHDALREKDMAEIDRRVGPSGARPLHFLVRREADFPTSVWQAQVNVTRQFPAKWNAIVRTKTAPPSPGAASKASASVPVSSVVSKTSAKSSAGAPSGVKSAPAVSQSAASKSPALSVKSAQSAASSTKASAAVAGKAATSSVTPGGGPASVAKTATPAAAKPAAAKPAAAKPAAEPAPAPTATPAPLAAQPSPGAPPPPYCVQVLGQSSDLVGAGLAGWAQSNIDDKILNDPNLAAHEKIPKLFGMKLNFTQFPMIKVTEVIPLVPDGSGPSRAAKNGIEVGDTMIMAGTLQDRVTLLPTWEGKGPNDAIVQKVQRKFARKDNPVAGFAFLRKKYEKRYVQLLMPDNKDWGINVENGKIIGITAGGIADKAGLAVNDRIVVAHDALREKDGTEIDKRVAPSGARPLHILVRRETDFPDSVLTNAVNTARVYPTNWAVPVTVAAAASPTPSSVALAKPSASPASTAKSAVAATTSKPAASTTSKAAPSATPSKTAAPAASKATASPAPSKSAAAAKPANGTAKPAAAKNGKAATPAAKTASTTPAKTPSASPAKATATAATKATTPAKTAPATAAGRTSSAKPSASKSAPKTAPAATTSKAAPAAKTAAAKAPAAPAKISAVSAPKTAATKTASPANTKAAASPASTVAKAKTPAQPAAKTSTVAAAGATPKTPAAPAAAPTPTPAPKPATAPAAGDPPYCAQLLGLSKDLVGAGLCGWAQSSIDDKILNDPNLSPEDKILKLFGMKLDWTTYPIVRVVKVEPQLPDNSGPSRAAKNNVVVGDSLVMVGTLQERVTLLPTWPGKDPNDAIIQKVQRKFARSDNPVASFAFLRAKYEKFYVQVELKDKEVGVKSESGKVVSVVPGGVFDKLGLQKDDRIIVAHDVLREKDPSEIDRRLAPTGARPMHILARRENQFPDAVLKNAVNVSRVLKMGGAAPAGAPALAPAGAPAQQTQVAYCAQMLGVSKDLVGAGLCGWAQSSIDDKVLNDGTKSAEDKIRDLFGLALDWSKYPVVSVTEVIPKLPDSSGPSRAAKNNVCVGDLLVAVGTLQERVTLLPTWVGAYPSDAIIQKVQRKFTRGDNPVAAFAFVRKKKLAQYVQLLCPADFVAAVGGMQENGVLTEKVAESAWAKDTAGLRAGDKLSVIHDFLVEKRTTAEIQAQMAKAPAGASISILFRRETEFPAEVLAKGIDVTRATPPGWKGKDGVA
ncbi:unnamed protein product [Amoebophrya sp. A120]|nr:unnamed protein product [Amoebophrya sp. A120]|eukprot:GSA120T00003043001.1